MAHDKTFKDEPMLDPKAADKAFKVAGAVGIIGVLASVGMAFSGEEAKQQFFFSWLTAFMLCLTIGLGGLFFVIIHHLTRAGWSTSTRRIAENLAINLPLMAVLFIPIAIGLHDLFHWSHAEAVAADPILTWKAGYLNPTFFFVRAVIFFAIWGALAWFFRSNSVKQDASGDAGLTHKMRRLAPVALVTFALSLTFAAFDWMMSLDPHWFSTMFGVYTFAGSVMAFFATGILAISWLNSKGALTHTITVANRHDFGKLMFGFTVFWAYVTFSQYYLIWYANIPEETVWFTHRSEHGWEAIGALIIIGHFIVPFWFLLSRHVKRARLALNLAAGWMLLMHFVDLHFVIMPTLHHGPHFHVLDLTAVLGVGGLFFAAFAYRFKKDAAVAHRDPQLVAAMGYDNA